MATGCLAAPAAGFAWLLAAFVLMLASVIDIRLRRIPNWLTGGAFVGGVVIAHAQGVFYYAVMAALLSALVIWLPNLLRDGSIGAGDVKLVGAIGALLGVASTLLLVGFAACAALAAMVTRQRPRKTRDRSAIVAFAPCLLAGYVLAAVARFSAG